MPNSIEIEQAVLGALLLSREKYPEVDALISSVDFESDVHKEIYELLERMSKDESIPHIIFHGVKGTGKKTMIKIFLEMLFDKSVVTSGVFDKYKQDEVTDETYNALYLDENGNRKEPIGTARYEHEWFIHNMLSKRGALFNAIGINMKILGREAGSGMTSGHVNMDI